MVALVALLVGGAFGGSLVLLGLASIRKAYRHRRFVRRAESAETVDIGAMTRDDGRVCIEGEALPVDETLDPAIARETEGLVVHSEVGRRQYKGRGIGPGVTHQYRQETTRAVPFVVADDTGRVRVDPPPAATVQIPPSDHTDVPDASDPPADVAAFLDASDDVILAGSASYRVRQGAIEPHQRVVVQGDPSPFPGWDTPDFVFDGSDLVVSTRDPDDVARPGMTVFYVLLGVAMLLGSLLVFAIAILGG